MEFKSFASYFTDTIVDNNGVAVSDINKGIKNLYDNVILTSDKSQYDLIMITDEDQGYPDLIAYKYFGDQNLWYYFLLTNAIEDPFEEVSVGWAYGIVNTDETEKSIDTHEEQNIEETSRIGSVLTLN